MPQDNSVTVAPVTVKPDEPFVVLLIGMLGENRTKQKRGGRRDIEKTGDTE
jgi:hypothetical protein